MPYSAAPLPTVLSHGIGCARRRPGMYLCLTIPVHARGHARKGEPGCGHLRGERSIWQVVNGIAAIVAIQGAGLGVSQAIWSALGIAISFLWGVAVFHEPIRSMPLAVAGALLPSPGCLPSPRALAFLQ